MHRASSLVRNTLVAFAFGLGLLLVLPLSAEAQPRPQIAASALVDVNTASHDELVSLPGVGPTLAERIIEARRQRPFSRPQELVRVQGIGPRTLSEMRPFVTVSEADR